MVGAIGATNRGPYDDFEDGFFKHHERRFAKAATFDLAMLEALGMHQVTVAYGKWPRPFRFAGPKLKDVLALDGFASEIGAADLAAEDWMVVVKRDGRYLDIGQRGPLWIVYGRRDGRAISDEDEQRWPWAAFLIDVK
ncbi:MAG: hypothetical protein EXQ96_03890 [Alphaproteobacteria bacterium]|nr:hypothetical protein [Alphaproteobacteria bacterium]